MQQLTIKELRKWLGITQSEAARVAYTTKQTICDWEHGRSTPRYVYNFNCLLKYYGVKLSQNDLLLLDKAFSRGIDLRRIKFKVGDEIWPEKTKPTA